MIAFDHVSKSHGADGAAAVKKLSLTVGHGEFLVPIDVSGCGTTTTLKMINRLIVPSAGTIRLEGVDIAVLDAVWRRRRIGYAFQEIGLFRI